MGLGRHLVRELGLQDRVDTLGRWMAHHVAELIRNAEEAETRAEQQKNQRLAVDTILKIWESRASLPGDAYPLSGFRDVARIISVLTPSANPFRFNAQDSRQAIAADLFSSLTRLIIVLLFMEAPRIPRKMNSTALKALSDEERRVLLALDEWVRILPMSDKSKKRKRTRNNKISSKMDFQGVAIGWVEHISQVLDNLKQQMKSARSSDRRN